MASITDINIAHAVLVQGRTRADAAREHGVSPRTVGRAITRVAKHYGVREQDLEETLNLEFDFPESDEDDSTDENCTLHWVQHNDPPYHFDVVASDSSITIIRSHLVEEEQTVTVTQSHAHWEEISDIVWEGRGSQESLLEAFKLASMRVQIEALQVGDITVDIYNDEVLYKGNAIPSELHYRIIEAGQRGDKLTMQNLCVFAERLMQNPSYRAVRELYRFLRAADIEIVEGGMVKCFKRVRSNYTDVHSGTFDNSIGVVVEIPRNMVDEDSSRTCSNGLHVCSAGYLAHFGGDRIVEVLVDPADFVAIPADYADSKARVCRYKVVADVTNQYVIGDIEPSYYW